eukprot:s656_g7.t1
MSLDTKQKKRSARGNMSKQRWFPLGWDAPPGPAVLPCAWHPGKTIASQGRQLMAGSGEGYADGFTATAVLGSGSDASGEEKPLKLKPNRLSKVMHIGRKPHSDIRFGNMAVSWQHMTVTLHRGSVSKGYKPKVTVKDLSTLGSAFKAAGKKRWARLDKDTETEVKSGTRFALPCKVTQKSKAAKAGEKQQSLHSCFALHFLETAPEGGWPTPILSDEEVAELAALGRGEQVASPTAAAEAGDEEDASKEDKKTAGASESKGKEAKAKKKTSEAPEDETPVPIAGPKDKAGSKKKKKEESSPSEKPDEKAEAGDSEDEGQDEEQLPKLASESDGEKPDKDGEDEEEAAVEVKADSDSEEKEEAEAKADSDSEEKEEEEAKADSDSEEKEDAEVKADSDSEEKEEAEAKADSDSEEKEEAEAKADSDSEEKEEAEAKADDSDSEEKAEAEDAKEDSDSEEQQKKESESSAEESPVARKKSDSESEKHARKKRRANRRKDSSEGSSSAQKARTRRRKEHRRSASKRRRRSGRRSRHRRSRSRSRRRRSEESEDDQIDEIPLWLHVYDLNETTGYLNNYGLKNASLGLFHAGVEVLGTEYFFGWGDTELSGIRCNRPRQHAVHAYRESVFMGMTPLSEEQVEEAIDSAFEQWPEINYHPIHRNCTLFAEELLGIHEL